YACILHSVYQIIAHIDIDVTIIFKKYKKEDISYFIICTNISATVTKKSYSILIFIPKTKVAKKKLCSIKCK
ncbi:hypothetical protein, partial [Francisella tularensis]|uniref:hypothetical protein n=1 Tax=Francisella tularensis TaxID=263 RepID=UPI001CC2D4DD